MFIKKKTTLQPPVNKNMKQSKAWLLIAGQFMGGIDLIDKKSIRGIFDCAPNSFPVGLFVIIVRRAGVLAP